MFHRLAKILFRQRVQHVGRSKPRAPRLQDAVLDLLEVRGVVGVGVDDDFYAAFARHPQVNVIQVEPVRISVQLHRDFAIQRCRENRVHVEAVGVAPQQ